jgi:hypothetical protein
MFFFIPFSIFYLQTTQIQTTNFYFGLPDFGFEVNGTFRVHFSNFDPEYQYCFALLQSDDYVNAITLEIPGDPCVSHRPHSFHFGENTTSTEFSGTITERGIYTAYISYYRQYQSHLEVTATQTYRNPNSHLDYRWNGILPIQFTVVSMCGLILGYWLINWFQHFSVQIGVHYSLSIFFGFVTVWAAIRAIEFVVLDQCDTAIGLTIIQIIMRMFAETMMFITILLIAKGWGIVKDGARVVEIIRSVVLGFLLAGCRVGLGFTIPMTAVIAIVFVTGVGVAFYLRELLQSTKDAAMHVLAHLLAIAQAGINARTTPIFQKWSLYRRFQYVLMAGFALILSYTCANGIWVIEYLEDELLIDSIALFLLGSFCFLFRLTDSSANGYSPVEVSDSDPEIRLSDLQSLTINSAQLNEGRMWEVGIPLPSPPHIVTANTRIEIASPDGTDTIEAQMV